VKEYTRDEVKAGAKAEMERIILGIHQATEAGNILLEAYRSKLPDWLDKEKTWTADEVTRALSMVSMKLVALLAGAFVSNELAPRYISHFGKEEYARLMDRLDEEQKETVQ